MNRTERLEEEYIEAVIEDERQSSGEPERKVGKIVLENTDEYNRAFALYDSEGNYLERE